MRKNKIVPSLIKHKQWQNQPLQLGLIIWLVLLLSGCAATPTSIPATATVAPTFAPTAVPTSTAIPPTPLPTLAVTATLAPPTATALPSPTPNPPKVVKAFTVNQGSKDVTAVDIESGTVLGKVSVGNGPHHNALSPDGSILWVINTDDSSASLIDPVNLTVKSTVKVGRSPHAVVFKPDGTEVWLANIEDSAVGIYNPQDGAKLGEVKLPFRPAHLDFAPDGQLWAVQQLGPLVAMIDPNNRKINTQFSVGEKLNLVTFAEGKAWLTDEGTRAGVWGVNLASLQPTDFVAGIAKPIHPLAVKNGTEVWVTDRAQAKLFVVEAKTGKVLETIATQGVSFHARLSRDGKKVLVTEEAANNLLVIDVATRQILKRVAVGILPDDIATE
jgi:YVTN family beta-propeller protein